MQTSALDKIATGQDNYEKYKDLFTTDKGDVVTMDSFYKLLVAEMSNQDPLEPTSNTEFISQLASFTSLQAQQDNFAMQKQNYANSLVGQTVTVQGSVKDDLVTGVVQSVSHGDDIMIHVEGKSYKLSAIKQVYGNTSQLGFAEGNTSQIGNYGAFAAGILGKTVMVQGIDANGEVVIDRGTASSLEIQDGIVRVVVNGMAYNVTDVVQVAETENPNASNSDADDEDDEIAVNPPAQKTENKPAAETPKTEPTEPTDETSKTETESAGQTGAITDRTDDKDLPDLIEDDSDDVPNPEAAAAQTENAWLSEQEPWITEGEASELYSLFGES